MAMTQCKNGHYYDTDTHASCPYCSSQQSIIDFSTPDGFGGATQAPADWGGSRARDDSHTQAPAGWGSPDRRRNLKCCKSTSQTSSMCSTA